MAIMTAASRLIQCGDGAVLIELDGLADVRQLVRSLRPNRPAGVLDVIPAARTVLVRFATDLVSREEVTRWVLSAAAVAPPTGQDSPEVIVPVRYDGPDLAEVAALAGLTTTEVVNLHTEARYTVAFCGFAPGFGYLVGSPAALQVPRRSSPRTTVPAGSVGLAGEFTGIYPRASPGGWQLIGTTDLELFDLRRDPPALLGPGVRVRFVEASSVAT